MLGDTQAGAAAEPTVWEVQRERPGEEVARSQHVSGDPAALERFR